MSNRTVSPEGGIMSGMIGIMMIAIMAPIMISCMSGVTPTPTPPPPSPPPPTPTPKTYSCPYCDAVFSTYEELVAHYNSEHPDEAREPIDISW